MTSASDVRAYGAKHEIGMLQAKKHLRRKKLDFLLSKAATMTDHGALIVVLRMIVEDFYPEDLDIQWPNGAKDRYPKDRIS